MPMFINTLSQDEIAELTRTTIRASKADVELYENAVKDFQIGNWYGMELSEGESLALVRRRANMVAHKHGKVLKFKKATASAPNRVAFRVEAFDADEAERAKARNKAKRVEREELKARGEYVPSGRGRKPRVALAPV